MGLASAPALASWPPIWSPGTRRRSIRRRIGMNGSSPPQVPSLGDRINQARQPEVLVDLEKMPDVRCCHDAVVDDGDGRNREISPRRLPTRLAIRHYEVTQRRCLVHTAEHSCGIDI